MRVLTYDQVIKWQVDNKTIQKDIGSHYGIKSYFLIPATKMVDCSVFRNLYNELCTCRVPEEDFNSLLEVVCDV